MKKFLILMLLFVLGCGNPTAAPAPPPAKRGWLKPDYQGNKPPQTEIEPPEK